MTPTSPNTLYLQAAPNPVYQSCGQILQQLGYELVNVDARALTIRGEKGLSLLSAGEVITLKITPISPTQTSVTIESKLKIVHQRLDWGKNAENITKIRAAILARYREIHQEIEESTLESFVDDIAPPSPPLSEAAPSASPLPVKPSNSRDPSRTVVLFLAAQPDDRAYTRLDVEARQIGERLNEGNVRDQFELEREFAVRATDLSRALLTYKPGIVHFSGHGEKEGIVLTNNDNSSRLLSGTTLAHLFRIVHQKYPIHCIVLNCCWSDEQAKALKAINIPYVIGTNTLIPDRVAHAFAAGFYRGLGFGLDIPTAFDLGKNETLLEADNTQWDAYFHLL